LRSFIGTLTHFALAGCITLGPMAFSSFGQTQSPGHSRPIGPPPARVDFTTLYSFLGIDSSVTTTFPYAVTESYKPIPWGAILGASAYFNRNWGATIEYGAHPDGPNDGIQTVEAGLIYRVPHYRWSPFVHALGGIARMGGPNDPAINLYHDYTWGQAVTGGGGFDRETPWLNHHLSIRVLQVDYTHLQCQYPEDGKIGGYTGMLSGGPATVNTYRLSAGLVYHLGSIEPAPPLALTCSASPASVFPGEPVAIAATPDNLNPKLNAIYTWSGPGVAGNGDSATVATASLAPGVYTVAANLKEGKPGKEGLKAGQSASCSTTFTVKALEQPTIACSANPAIIKPGENTTIASVGMSPQNRPLTYSYSATAGSVSGNGASATYSSAGAPTGVVGVNCTVTDDRGQTATASTNVTITAPYAPPATHVQPLCSIGFSNSATRPTRVDNEAKACLDEVALALQRSADAAVILVGQSSASEKASGQHLDAQRAVNTKEYLVTGKGIDAARISVATGSADSQTVENYLVPAGAVFTNDVPGTTPVDESLVKPQTREPLGKKSHRK
jgi:hypothetical protein